MIATPEPARRWVAAVADDTDGPLAEDMTPSEIGWWLREAWLSTLPEGWEPDPAGGTEWEESQDPLTTRTRYVITGWVRRR